MQRYEYKVVPAPRRGEKVKGIKTTPDRFAHALGVLMNELGRDGWEYLRAETLPCEERVGFTGRTTTYQNLLVFRRVVPQAAAAAATPAASGPGSEGWPAAPAADAAATADVPEQPLAEPVPAAAAAVGSALLPEPDPLDAAVRRLKIEAVKPAAHPVFGRIPRLMPVPGAKPAVPLGPAGPDKAAR